MRAIASLAVALFTFGELFFWLAPETKGYHVNLAHFLAAEQLVSSTTTTVTSTSATSSTSTVTSATATSTVTSTTTTRALVIVIGQLRGGVAAHRSFLRFAVQEFNADLALCVSRDTLQNSPELVAAASFVWPVDEPADWGDYFDLIARTPTTMADPAAGAQRATEIAASLVMEGNNSSVVPGASRNCRPPGVWTFKVNGCGVNVSTCEGDTSKRWHKLLNIVGNWKGGLGLSRESQSSGAILLVFRWLLQQQLLARPDLLRTYQYFIVTRADYLYLCPHPPLGFPPGPSGWIAAGEWYNGVTDRHLVARSESILQFLNVTTWILQNPELVVEETTRRGRVDTVLGCGWNIEAMLGLHLQLTGLRIAPIILTAFTVKVTGGPATKGSHGHHGTGSGEKMARTFGFVFKYLSEVDQVSAQCKWSWDALVYAGGNRSQNCTPQNDGSGRPCGEGVQEVLEVAHEQHQQRLRSLLAQ